MPPAATLPAAAHSLTPFIFLTTLQLCRQLLERGWRVAALCRHSSIALDALTESAGASGDGSHVGNISQLTIIEAVDVAEDSCGALISRALMDAPVSAPLGVRGGNAPAHSMNSQRLVACCCRLHTSCQ